MNLSNKIEEARVTILLPFDITSGNNTFYFRPFNQYCYTIENGRIIITIDDIKYDITGQTISLDVRKLSEEEQLTPLDAEKKRLVDEQVHDYKKETLDVLGLDIEANERTDYNGRWLDRILHKKESSINE